MSKLLSRQGVRDLCLGLGLLCATLALMFWPQEAMEAAREGLRLCYNVILPSLFPFFVLSALVVDLGLAGYIGGVVDDVMMRFSEMIQSFPPLILAMVIAAALGPNISNSVLAMAIIWWPNYARLTRSIVISVKQNDYVTASRVLGATHTRILGKELLPNSIGSMVVMCTLDLGNAILMFSGLSFLGLGVQPPVAEWGYMVSDGVRATANWWVATFPGLAIFSVAIGANFIGDGLRDYLDPKMRTAAG